MPKSKSPQAPTPAVAEPELRYDPSTAEAAFEASKPEILAINPEEVQPLNTNLEKAIRGVFKVIESAKATGLPEALLELPRKFFDPEQFPRLERLVWTAWYLEQTIGPLEQNASDAALPPKLLAEATELEKRMQACAEYHLSDDPVAASELDYLRPGTGHYDLANDLFGYARIYDDYADILRRDPKNYRVGDALRARELSAEILQLLSRPRADVLAGLADLRDRTWMLLARAYEDVAATARWIHRNDRAKRAPYINLLTLGRSQANRAGRKPAASTPSDATPAVPPPASDPAAPEEEPSTE